MLGRVPCHIGHGIRHGKGKSGVPQHADVVEPITNGDDRSLVDAERRAEPLHHRPLVDCGIEDLQQMRVPAGRPRRHKGRPVLDGQLFRHLAEQRSRDAAEFRLVCHRAHTQHMLQVGVTFPRVAWQHWDRPCCDRMNLEPPAACRVQLAVPHQQIVVAAQRCILEQVREMPVHQQTLRAVLHQLGRNRDAILTAPRSDVMQCRTARRDDSPLTQQGLGDRSALKPRSTCCKDHFHSRITRTDDRLTVALRDPPLTVEQRAIEITHQHSCRHGNPQNATLCPLMDRKRLANVQQSDLTESRINDDFLFWLKNSGPNWLLAVLVVLCLAMGWNWWKNKQGQARDAAWSELSDADIPATLRDVAAKHADVDGVASFALLTAADRYLQSVISGQRFDREASAADAAVTPELRREWLLEARTLYGEVLARAESSSDPNAVAFEVAALFGLAAVAESRGEVDAAKSALERVHAKTAESLPWISKQAKARIETIALVSSPYQIPDAPMPQAVLPDGTRFNLPTGVSVTDQDAVRALIGGLQGAAAIPAPDQPIMPATPTDPAAPSAPASPSGDAPKP